MDAIEVQVTQDGETRTLGLHELPVSFGRDPACEVWLRHPFVSRRHGRIERGDEGILIVDEGSTNGFRCGGVRVAAHGVALLGADGGDFEIEGVTVSVRIPALAAEVTATTPDEAPAEDPTAPVPVLELRELLHAEKNAETRSSLD